MIDAGKDKPAQLARRSVNRGEAYREKGDLDNAIKDLGESIDLDGKNAACLLQPRHRAARQGRQLDAAIADLRPGDQDRSAQRSVVLHHPQPRLLREARLRARHRRSDPGDQAQSEQRADDLQSRHGLSRQGRARARGAGLRSGPEDQRRTTRSPFTTAAWPIATCATTTAPSGFRPGDQAQSELHRGAERPRPRLCRQGRDRSRHRRFRPGDPAQPEGLTRLQQPRPGLSQQGRDRPRDQQLRSGHSDQPGFRAGLLQPRQRLLRQARLRPRHRRLQPGDQDQSELRAGLLRPRRRLFRPARIREGGGRSEQGDRARSARMRWPTTIAA